MPAETSTYIPKGYVVHKGVTHLRVPNSDAADIWNDIKALNASERNSMIGVLANISHPAADRLAELNRHAIQYLKQ